MELTVINRGEQPFEFTAALHTYLRVDDVATTRIGNLGGLKYFDAALKREAVQTEDTVTFPGEIDRVYFDAAKMIVCDGHRSCEVQSAGFPDGVIWNPGEKLATTLADLDPGGYRRFVCVEAAIFRAPIVLEPSITTWRGGQIVTAVGNERGTDRSAR
jgi:glucose-6-phosphate 1-epimerase